MSVEGGDDVQRIAGRFSCRHARARHVRAVAAGTGAGRARILLSASESSSSGACGSRWPPGGNGTETYAKRGHRVRVAAGVVRPQTRGQREGKLPSVVPLATAWLPPLRQPSFWREGGRTRWARASPAFVFARASRRRRARGCLCPIAAARSERRVRSALLACLCSFQHCATTRSRNPCATTHPCDARITSATITA